MTESFREHEFLEWLRRRAGRDARVPVSIGDDAAVWRVADGHDVLLAVDTVVEGTHVVPGRGAAEALARKAVRSNVSDIAAMGGRPETALLALLLPADADVELAQQIGETVEAECAAFGMVLVGGDTVVTRGPLAISLTITGRPIGRPVLRSGARTGDLILATGAFGGSILGHHVDFVPRVREAEALVRLGPPTSMTDVSDGLLRDLQNLLDASGCGAVVRAADVPIAPAACQLALATGRTALDHALYDGEDFELLLTLSPDRLDAVRAGWNIDTPLTVLGRIVDEGLTLEDADGRRPVLPGGYEHAAARGGDA